MKKRFYLLVLFFFSGSVLLTQAFAQEPTPVLNWDDLNNIRNDLSGDYVLQADLDQESAGYATYNTGDGWVPITVFTGTFEGNSHTISGLTSTTGGLFGVIDGGKVENLGLEDVAITSTVTSVAPLAGLLENGAEVLNSYTTGTLDGTGSYGNGGLVGRINTGSAVRRSWSSVDATHDSEGNNGRSGGLVGQVHNGTIEDSYFSGSFIATGEDIGGLVGIVWSNGNVVRSYSIGQVDGTVNVGGLVGRLAGSESSSFWDIEASGIDSSAAGTGLTTAEMHDGLTYLHAGWEIVTTTSPEAVWGINPDANMGYPFLTWQGYDPVPVEPVFSGGIGTEEDPFQLISWSDLDLVRDYADAHFVLMNDLDEGSPGYAGTGDAWSPIDGFTGNFDGNGHTINGLTSTIGGLFAEIRGEAILKNLGVINANISSATDNAGILVDAAQENPLIENCFSTGSLVSSGRSSQGGLVGRLNGVGATILGSWSSAEVVANAGNARWTGGLVGYLREGLIEDSYATGNVTTAAGQVAGLVGRAGAGTDLPFIVRNSYSTGQVSGTDFVGGLLGRVLADEGVWEVAASFWDMEASGIDSSAGGTGLTTAEMQDGLTYVSAGWDIVTTNSPEAVWGINPDANLGYPFLTWQGYDPVPVEVELEPQVVVVEPDNYPEEIGKLNRVIEEQIAINPQTTFILKRDAVYWLDGTISNEDFNLHIETEEGSGHPPIIRPASGGSFGNLDKMFVTHQDFTLDGIFVNAANDEGELLVLFLDHLGTDARVSINNSRLMHSNGTDIRLAGAGNSLFVTNSVIKNHGRVAGGTVGRVVDNAGNQDTIYFENNTIHNIQHSLMRNPNHTVGYYHVNHNTIMYVGQYTRIRRAVDMTFTNNLVLNFFTHGMTEGSTGSGIIELSDIDGVNNEDRNLVVSNNNIGYIDQPFLDIIANAGKVPVPVVNTSHAGIVTMEGNIEERVSFVDEPDMDQWEQWALLNEGQLTPAPDYPVAFDRWLDAFDEPAPAHFTTALDRDFTYSSGYASYRVAENGYPVGDLNWFPDLKELWVAGEPAPDPDFISVSTWEDLHNVRDDLDGDYVLQADLDHESAGYADYNTGDGWVSIEGFTGTFDGNGRTISGLTSTIGGLFSEIRGEAIVKNLGLVNANISSSTNNAGILVDWAHQGALIENCFSTGTLTTSARSSHGGLVGRTDDVETTIRGSWSSADVTVTRGGTDARWTGGLAGYIREGLIEDSYATGNVVSTGENVGGLAGRVGLSSTQGIVRNSYSTGQVSGDRTVGGLLGAIGALEAGSEVVASFWDTESSGMDESDGGEGLSTAEMKTESTFTDAGWDFTEVWAMDSEIHSGYPHLRHAVHVDDPDLEPVEITFANVQWPEDGEIKVGEEFTVYARVEAEGVTDNGESGDLQVWIGYNEADVAPDASGWTWVEADFNSGHTGTGHEYMAEIGSGLTAGTYFYVSRFQLKAQDYVYGGFDGGFWDGEANVSGVLVVSLPTDAAVADIPKEFGLQQNYPNPFNPVTSIQYQVPESAHVSIRVYNVLGQRVATLVNEVRDAGYHSVQFDGSRLASGIYIYRMDAGEFVQTYKLILAK